MVLMTSKERVLQRERDRGKAAALNLAARAPEMNGTAIIAEQSHVPAWHEDAVYTAAHVGFPVQDDGQVYTILQPHTPAHNPGFRPVDLPAIYSIKHTTDPARAKPYVAPNGISGVYMLDECCVMGGRVYQSLFNDNAYSPEAWPQGWKEVQL